MELSTAGGGDKGCQAASRNLRAEALCRNAVPSRESSQALRWAIDNRVFSSAVTNPPGKAHVLGICIFIFV